MVRRMTAETQPSDAPCPQAAASAESEMEAKPAWRNIALLALGAGLLLAVVYLSPLRHYHGRLREVSEYLRSLGLLAPLVLTGSVAVLVAVGFPRLLFCVIAGMALGFWSGLFWTQVGTLLGNYAVFLVVRHSSGDWAQRYLSRRGRLDSLVREEGLAGAILARQLPLPGLLVNLACGLVGFRHRHFLLGTVIGQLPQAVPFTLIGAGMLQASFGRSMGLIALAVALAMVVWLALRYVLRRQRGA